MGGETGWCTSIGFVIIHSFFVVSIFYYNYYFGLLNVYVCVIVFFPLLVNVLFVCLVFFWFVLIFAFVVVVFSFGQCSCSLAHFSC